MEHLIVQMEKERGLDRSAAIADMRFNFIEKVCEKTVVKPKASRERIRSEKIDRILTGKYTAISMFYRYYAVGVLPYVPCDRRFFTEPACHGD